MQVGSHSGTIILYASEGCQCSRIEVGIKLGLNSLFHQIKPDYNAVHIMQEK